MTVLTNPTKEQVRKFCALIEKQLLAAIDRGAIVEIASKQEVKDVFTPDYGGAPVDALYVGAKFRAEFRERGI